MTNQGPGGWPAQPSGGGGGWPQNQGQGLGGWPQGQSGGQGSGGWPQVQPPQQGPGWGQQPHNPGQWQPQPGSGWGSGPTGPGGPGAPTGGSGGPGKPGGKGPLLVIIAGALALVLVGVVAFAVLRTPDAPIAADPPASPSTNPTPLSPSATPSPSASSTSDNTTCPTVPTPAQVAGWKAIASTRDGAAVDVPADWELNNGLMWGFEGESKDMVLAHCAGLYLKGVCGKPLTDRGRVGFITYGSRGNPTGDVGDLVRNWARLAQYDNKTKVQHPVPEPTITTVKVNNQTVDAKVATIVHDVAAPSADCPAPKQSITIVTADFTANSKATMVLVRHVGIDKELSTDIEQQIIGSLRPL